MAEEKELTLWWKILLRTSAVTNWKENDHADIFMADPSVSTVFDWTEASVHWKDNLDGEQEWIYIQSSIICFKISLLADSSWWTEKEASVRDFRTQRHPNTTPLIVMDPAVWSLNLCCGLCPGHSSPQMLETIENVQDTAQIFLGWRRLQSVAKSAQKTCYILNRLVELAVWIYKFGICGQLTSVLIAHLLLLKKSFSTHLSDAIQPSLQIQHRYMM
jgi:hypothetical protein